MRKLSSLFVVITLVSLSALPIGCTAVYGPAAPGQTADQKIVEDLQKSIIVIHENLYKPAMIILGAQLDAGKITPAREKQIQTLSEKYQKAKTDADAIIKAWGTVRSASEDRAALAAKIGEMSAAIADVNRSSP